MKRKISKLFPAVLAAMMVFSATGCSGSSEEGATSEPVEGSTAEENTDSESGEGTQGQNAEEKQTADAENSELTFWFPPFASGDDGALDKEFWVSALEPWAKENNVDLTVEIIPWGNYEEKHLTGYSAGEGPDVTYMYSEMIGSFIDMGIAEPLDGYLTDEEREHYVYIDKGIIQGKQYMLPIVVGNARILVVNKDIMDKAGVTKLPETWQELIDVGLKVKEANLDGVMPFAQEWADPAIGALNNIYYPYLWQAGGDLYNEDETEIALLDTDAAVRAAQLMYDLRYKYEILPEESMSLVTNELLNQFKAGNIAMAYMDTKAASQLTESGINWDFVPSLEDKTKAIWIATDGLVVNSASKNKDLAVKLAKYITDTEVMTRFHKEITPYPPITADEEYLDDERYKAMYEDTEHLKSLPKATNAFKVMDTLYKNLQLMMLDEMTPEEAIGNTVEYSKSIG